MYVYIRHGDTIRRLSNVTLREYSVPQCGPNADERLDPALWFKVLVLDSLLVECDRRNVYWNRDTPSEPEDIHGYRDSQLSVDLVWDFFHDKVKLFDSEDHAEYDPSCDDLFHTALQLHQQLDTDSNSQAALETTFKLFHMFILPQIVFKTEDRSKVQQVLHSLEQYHEIHIGNIEKTMTSEKNTERSLKEQTKELFSKEHHFSKASYIASCDREFLSVFLDQLDCYVEQAKLAISGYAEKATPLRKSKDEKDQILLKQLRTEKDILNEAFKKAIVIREEIRGHIKKQASIHENVRHCSFELQMAYLKTYRGLQIIRDEMHKLVKTKIKISAVREAVLLSLNEIDTSGSSYGYLRIKGSFFEAESDLLDMDKLPGKWATIPAKVNTCLEDCDTGLMDMHLEFCEMIKLLCGQLMREMTGNSRKASNRKTLIHSCENNYTSRWSMGSISRESCESICTKINDHILEFASTITKHVVEDYPDHSRDLVNKVHMCYSEKVSVQLMSTLCELYEENYRELVHELHAWLVTVSATSLCGGDISVLTIIENLQDDTTPVPCPHTDSDYERLNITSTRLESLYVMPDTINVRPISDTGTARSRSKKRSQRKRHGVSFTPEQAGKILTVPSIADDIHDQGDSPDYVDMSSVRISKSSLDRLYAKFGEFKQFVRDVTDDGTISGKRRAIAGLLRYIQNVLSSLKALVQDEEPVSADDLIDVILLLLCDLDYQDLHRLYAHINLLHLLCPSFMSGSLHAYAVVTFNASYIHLFEQAKHRCAKI